ncbi:hypothetical protein PLESTB_001173200 [Pleodorina starrii]|uniref:Protein odr-4 homolog n=1 Tax=Pleodorina starrii TaxID=330485 RepID=A0A9W6F5B4_9CHLO|nr:hypothetical protein PLESTM_000249200 [Pleodorina starrii]GLC57012.1 hypothetical protein PLESTB_001173200 [Pleodorina starrii]GLC64844.1 hypothetical protein PLESTF_000213400 [Pleodorina starrii]
MARTCQADDALEKQFEALLKQQAGPEVGLLVGKHATGAKALLYGTIKTPSQEQLEPIVVAGGAGPPAGGQAARRRAGGPAAGGGGAAVSLEVEWITEHARQVARMLPGGLSVLGLYVFCPEAAYSVAAPQLCALLAGLAAACLSPTGTATTAAGDAAAAAGGDAQQQQQHQQPYLLLLHIDSTSRKQALRALPVSTSVSTASASASVSSLRPVELKFAPTLGSLVLLRCWHGVDLALPVPTAGAAGGGGGGEGGSGAQLRRQLAALVAAESERIRCGVFVAAGGSVPAESAQVGEALSCPSGSGSGSSGPLHVPTFDLTFLAPPRCLEPQPHTSAEAAGAPASQSQTQQAAGLVAVGQARLRGCLQGLAFVGKREAVGRAVADLKADLLASLSARLDLLVEEAARVSEQLQEEGQQQEGQQGATAAAAVHPLLSAPTQLGGAAGRCGGCDVALPRRVLLPWLGGGLALCDYLLEGEPSEAAAERARELLALQAEKGCQVVVEHEMPPAAAAAAGPWQPNVVAGEGLQGGGKAAGASSAASLSSRLSCGVTMAASLAVAAVASAVGLLSLLGQPAGQQPQ